MPRTRSRVALEAGWNHPASSKTRPVTTYDLPAVSSWSLSTPSPGVSTCCACYTTTCFEVAAHERWLPLVLRPSHFYRAVALRRAGCRRRKYYLSYVVA